jgi:hypothetical protein
MKWERTMPREEVKAIDFFLRGGDSVARSLVSQLIDRIEMNERTKAHHDDPAIRVVCTARVEAYRYVIMAAIRLQEAEALETTKKCGCKIGDSCRECWMGP